MLRSQGLIAAILLTACVGADEEAHPPVCPPQESNSMVWIPGGSFIMEEGPHYREEGPPREIEVDGFWMARTEVTNAQFSEFGESTGHVTIAERNHPPLPGAPAEMLQPGSAGFRAPTPDNPAW